jgi:predicted P-loop ATPase
VTDYDPFQFYLNHLPPWNEDMDDYIMELAMSVIVKGEAEEQLLFCQCLKKWLVGMVACWLDPKVVNNVILVLIGAQGSYKTTWFSYLLPPELRAYFRIKTNASRMTKDDLLALTQYGLVCYEELDTMGNRELNELKSAVTMPTIDERPAYGRYHEHRRHLASFCGTGNNVQFLSDPTGNRRWLPFEVDTIQSPLMFPFNYAGIYSQARRLYRDGFQYWFSQAEIQRLNSHNRQFETPRLETELVDIFFRQPNEHETGEFMPVARAMQIIGGNTTQKLSAVMIGRAFTELGYECRRTNHSRGYLVVQRSGLEIKERMKDMAVTGDG